MITLVMLSGGLDSAYTLVKLLTETDDEIIVHHINLITNLNRHIPERESCQKIIKYCKENYRSLNYTESLIDHRKFLAHGYDLIAAGFEAGALAASYHLATKKNIDRWTVGISAADSVPPDRFESAQHCCDANCQQGIAPELFLLPPVSQGEIISALPVELYKMTWSCRAPKKQNNAFVPCGTCATCERLKSHSHPDLAKL